MNRRAGHPRKMLRRFAPAPAAPEPVAPTTASWTIAHDMNHDRPTAPAGTALPAVAKDCSESLGHLQWRRGPKSHSHADERALSTRIFMRPLTYSLIRGFI